MKKSVLLISGMVLSVGIAFAGKPKAEKVAFEEIPAEAVKFVEANFEEVPVKATTRTVIDGVPTYQVKMKDKSVLDFDMCGAWNSIQIDAKKREISTLVYPDAVSKVLTEEFAEKKVAYVSNDGMYYSFTFADGAKATVNAIGVVTDVQNTGKKKK